MQWHKEILRGFRDNAAYEVGRYVILLIWPFALAGIYAGLSWLGTIHWNWRINAGLLLIAIIILCFTALKMIKQRPTATKARLSKLSRHLDERIEDGRAKIETIEQRRKESEPSATDVIRHEAWEKQQAEQGIAIHLPRANEVKRPIHYYYDQLQTLIQTGSEMLERLKDNTAPIPTEEQVAKWARQLDDVATCCATVAERQALKSSKIDMAFEDAFIHISAGALAEYYDRITDIFSKLTVGKSIAARIYKEDKT
jgi:hypothetical protein